VVGELFDGDASLSLCSDDDHFIFLTDAGNMRYVHDGDIHAHAAEDGRTLAADEYVAAVGEASVESVIVPYGEDGDFGAPRGGECTSVAYARAFRQFLYRGDFGFEGKHWLEFHTSFKANFPDRFARIVAVNGESWAHHVEMRGGLEKQGCTVGAVNKREAGAVFFDSLDEFGKYT